MTSISEGTGISVSPNPITSTGTISTDFNAVQARVTGTPCPSGQAISDVAQSGAATCIPVGGGTAGVTSLATGPGLSENQTTGDITLSVAAPFALSGASSSPIISGQNTDVGPAASFANTDSGIAGDVVQVNGVAAGSIGNPQSTAVLSATLNNTSAVGPAVYGNVNSIFGNSFTAGLAGESSGTGGYTVYAEHTNTAGFGEALFAQTDGLGIGAQIVNNNSSNTNPALVAQTTGTGNSAEFDGGAGVQINGNLNVSGSISAGVKDFKIDDPADPANKYLIHTSVESPQAENVYNGNISTDSRGFATVHLPAYFDSENIDPRYQLTVIGSFAQAIVWKRERSNRFVIRTNRPHVEVSWQVSAVRNDPYSRSQRGSAEQLKPAADRGHYLDPSGYGLPGSRRLLTAAVRPRRLTSRRNGRVSRVQTGARRPPIKR